MTPDRTDGYAGVQGWRAALAAVMALAAAMAFAAVVMVSALMTVPFAVRAIVHAMATLAAAAVALRLSTPLFFWACGGRW